MKIYFCLIFLIVSSFGQNNDPNNSDVGSIAGNTDTGENTSTEENGLNNSEDTNNSGDDLNNMINLLNRNYTGGILLNNMLNKLSDNFTNGVPLRNSGGLPNMNLAGPWNNNFSGGVMVVPFNNLGYFSNENWTTDIPLNNIGISNNNFTGGILLLPFNNMNFTNSMFNYLGNRQNTNFTGGVSLNSMREQINNNISGEILGNHWIDPNNNNRGKSKTGNLENILLALRSLTMSKGAFYNNLPSNNINGGVGNNNDMPNNNSLGRVNQNSWNNNYEGKQNLYWNNKILRAPNNFPIPPKILRPINLNGQRDETERQKGIFKYNNENQDIHHIRSSIPPILQGFYLKHVLDNNYIVHNNNAVKNYEGGYPLNRYAGVKYLDTNVLFGQNNHGIVNHEIIKTELNYNGFPFDSDNELIKNCESISNSNVGNVFGDKYGIPPDMNRLLGGAGVDFNH